MIYESNLSVAEGLTVVIVPKKELNDFNKELRALRKCLENDYKPYNNCRKRFAGKRKCRIYTPSVYYERKCWLDLIPIILSFIAFVVSEVLQLDCGSMDILLYILAVFSQTVYLIKKSKISLFSLLK